MPVASLVMGGLVGGEELIEYIERFDISDGALHR